jgi:hypothetical protein
MDYSYTHYSDLSRFNTKFDEQNGDIMAQLLGSMPVDGRHEGMKVALYAASSDVATVLTVLAQGTRVSPELLAKIRPELFAIHKKLTDIHNEIDAGVQLLK